MEILRTGPRTFLLLNTRTGAQLSCGAEERLLLYLLENQTSPDVMMRAYEQRFGQRLPRPRLLSFLEQLRQLDLLTEGPEVPAAEPALPPVPAAPVPPPAPLSHDDPAAGVNRFFDVLVALFGWVAHPLAAVPVLLLAALALVAVVRNGDLFRLTLASPRQWLPPLAFLVLLPVLTILLLSLSHSVFRGILARRYGARLRSFGFQLHEGLVPTFYCDLGDSFALLKERGRWAVLSSGIWWFLALGSFCVLSWALCKPGSVAAAFWIWMVPACAVSLFCQCVPFFQQGAYFMLCYCLDQPRLMERALAETRAWLNWERSPEVLTGNERYWFRFYGLGFYLFRMLFDSLVIFLIGSAVMHQFRGPGVLAFGVLLVCWYRTSLGRLFMQSKTLAWLFRLGGSPWLRWPLRLLLFAAVVALGFVPYNREVVGECRLIPLTQYGARAQLTDEIAQVQVREGDLVAPGAVIAVLSGRSVTEGYHATQAELDRAQAQLDLLKAGPRAEDVKIAEQRVQLWQGRTAFAEQLLKREEQLLNTGASNRQEYERIKRDHDTAQDQYLMAQEAQSKLKSGYREEEIRAAEAQVRLQQVKLKFFDEQRALTRVVTPVGGRVITPYLEQKRGQQARAGELIAVIQDTNLLRVEVAAEDAAAEEVKEGMRVNVRLHGLNGRLLTGRVRHTALAAEQDRLIGISTVRTDSEIYQEKMTNSRSRVGTTNHVRVIVDLDDYPSDLKPDMTGYARIVVSEDDVLWRALVRPVARFLRTEVWSWLP